MQEKYKITKWLIKIILALAAVGFYIVFYLFSLAFCDSCTSADIFYIYFMIGLTIVSILFGLLGKLYYKKINFWLELFLITLAPFATFFILAKPFTKIVDLFI